MVEVPEIIAIDIVSENSTGQSSLTTGTPNNADFRRRIILCTL